MQMNTSRPPFPFRFHPSPNHNCTALCDLFLVEGIVLVVLGVLEGAAQSTTQSQGDAPAVVRHLDGPWRCRKPLRRSASHHEFVISGVVIGLKD
jgi:hypothetical protein